MRDALVSFRAKSFRGKSFRLPAAAELLSLCVAKEKVTKEKGHPAYAPCGHPARKVRVRVTGFVDRASCPDAKLAGIPAGHPAGFPSPVRRFRGGPGRAAGHRGPHFSERPEQRRSNSSAVLRSGAGAVAFAFASALELHHRVRATMARRSTRGPLRGGETWTTGRVAGTDRDVGSFSRGQDARSKSPAPAHGLAGQEPGKRQAGCRFLLVTSLLDKQKRSNSPSEGGRKLFASKQQRHPELSRLKSLPQAQMPC